MSRGILARGGLWAIVLAGAGLPLLWLLTMMLTRPEVWVEARPDAYRLRLLGRTLLLALLTASIATTLALPAIFVLGRGRGMLARLLWPAVLVPVVIPSLVSGYGWSQLLLTFRIVPMPAGVADMLRCCITLAAWLWPIVAVIGALRLRRLDPAIQEQALLDRAPVRITLRLLAPAIIGGAGIVAVLATQEFAVWEPTGISVIATEVRMVFDTGAFSSSDNPMIAPGGLMLVGATDQASRAAAAVGVAVPMLVTIALLTAVSLLLIGRDIADDTSLHVGRWPATLDAGWIVIALAWLIWIVATLLPIAGLVISLGRIPDPGTILDTFRPQLLGSVRNALLAGALGVMMGLLASVVRSRAAAGVGVVAFLVGGQIVSIALVRLFNRPTLGMDEWLYNSPASAAIALAGRYGWIALIVAAATYSGGWRMLRDQAALDGAGVWRIAGSVVWPIAWPGLLAAGVATGVLALVDVPISLMLAPDTLVPLLMTWVHMLRFEPMIEASLLSAGLVGAGAVGIAVLVGVARRREPG